MTTLLQSLRGYADMGDRKMNVVSLPLDIFELAIAEIEKVAKMRDTLEWSENNCPGKCKGVIAQALQPST